MSCRKDQPHVHLINVGDVPAMPASEFRPGDRVMWNFGTTQTITRIAANPRGSKLFITIVDDNGKEWTFEKRPGTLMAIGYKAPR